MAGNLNTQFNFLNDALTLDYNTIVYDWSRLSEVGPETQQAGYWGLFWPDELTGIVIPYLVNGYQITVMKALLPLTYNLHEVVGQTSASIIPFSVPLAMHSTGGISVVALLLRQSEGWERLTGRATSTRDIGRLVQ